jgi:hypothetical protein
MSIALRELNIVWEGKRDRRAEKCKLETEKIRIEAIQ